MHDGLAVRRDSGPPAAPCLHGLVRGEPMCHAGALAQRQAALTDERLGVPFSELRRLGPKEHPYESSL
eukprot:11908340-Alexandrium_andersonii.AAC.1